MRPSCPRELAYSQGPPEGSTCCPGPKRCQGPTAALSRPTGPTRPREQRDASRHTAHGPRQQQRAPPRAPRCAATAAREASGAPGPAAPRAACGPRRAPYLAEAPAVGPGGSLRHLLLAELRLQLPEAVAERGHEPLHLGPRSRLGLSVRHLHPAPQRVGKDHVIRIH